MSCKLSAIEVSL